MSGADIDCDVLIVGGGLVGTTLALALSRLPLQIVLVESHDVTAPVLPGFDARATALAEGSRRILESLSLWQGIAPRAAAIRRIHVSERGRFGTAWITAESQGLAALGYTIENRELGGALWAALRGTERFRLLAPARFRGMVQHSAGLYARIEIGIASSEQAGDDAASNGANKYPNDARGDGGISFGSDDLGRTPGAPAAEQIRVNARLLIAADGAQSGIRALLGVAARRDDYRQTAVIFNCLPQRPLDGLAFERFTPQGPLALLPLPGDRAGVVWSVPADAAAGLLQLDAANLGARLDQALGGRLGPLRHVGERAGFALQRVRSTELRGARTVLLGSAAVNLHPVAGQGFNLAMRDVAWLAEVIAETLAAPAGATGHPPDIGAADVLSVYARRRCRDQASVAAVTHGLVRLFGLPLPGAGHARGLGLLAFDLLPGGKQAFARHAMGRSGRQPRLACGQALAAPQS